MTHFLKNGGLGLTSDLQALLHRRMKHSNAQATLTNYIRISGGTTLYFLFKLCKLNLRTNELGHIRS